MTSVLAAPGWPFTGGLLGMEKNRITCDDLPSLPTFPYSSIKIQFFISLRCGASNTCDGRTG